MELTDNRVLCFRAEGRKRQGRPAAQERREQAVKPVEAICCRACGGVVTARDEKIQVAGSHAHTFFNPAGIVFELGCFLRAPGCVAAGSPSAEFSWFPGYLWRVATCRKCRVHLGWLFASEGDSFYGLILTKLRE